MSATDINYRSDPGRFSGSRRMAWVSLCVIALQTAAVTIWPSPELAQVLVVAIPMEAGLTAAWTGVTNWAEVRRP